MDASQSSTRDFVALDPAGREMIVYQTDSSYQIVDVMLVMRLQVKAKNGTHQKKKI